MVSLSSLENATECFSTKPHDTHIWSLSSETRIAVNRNVCGGTQLSASFARMALVLLIMPLVLAVVSGNAGGGFFCTLKTELPQK